MPLIVAGWQPFWISVTMYCILLNFLDTPDGASFRMQHKHIVGLGTVRSACGFNILLSCLNFVIKHCLMQQCMHQ